jgi:hypothetical protein
VSVVVLHYRRFSAMKTVAATRRTRFKQPPHVRRLSGRNPAQLRVLPATSPPTLSARVPPLVGDRVEVVDLDGFA